MREPETREQLLDHIRAHPVEGTVQQKREAFRARLLPPDGPGTPAEVGGVSGLLFGGGLDALKAVFLHGGGYVLGSPDTQGHLVQTLAEALGGSVLAARYPLAPEHVWPAQLDAVRSLAEASAGRLALVGSSSGGHLALNLALEDPGAFSALALFSPNTDRTGRSETREANTPLDAMNSDTGDREFFKMSMPGIAPDDPQASPLLADLSGLPPTFLSATEGEVLLGDTLLLRRALEDADVPHYTYVASYDEAGMHMFESWPGTLPAGSEAIKRAGVWIGQHVSRSGAPN